MTLLIPLLRVVMTMTRCSYRLAALVARELRGIRNTFRFHEDNNDIRKFLIFVLVTSWAVITIGIAFEEAAATPTYGMLTALIWALVGRVWGDEVKDATEVMGE